MATVELTAPTRPAADQSVVVRAVTLIMGTVVGLTFLFGFGNVLTLALRLGVPTWVAPLVAPAVDLSILGLLLGTRHLALHGATPQQLRTTRRLLIFASLTTLALNVAEPLLTGQYGKATFDAVGPAAADRLGRSRPSCARLGFDVYAGGNPVWPMACRGSLPRMVLLSLSTVRRRSWRSCGTSRCRELRAGLCGPWRR